MTQENESATNNQDGQEQKQGQGASPIPDIRPGDTIKVYQVIPDTGSSKHGQEKEKIQIFEGVVLAKRRGKEIGATITVRKIIDRIGVERIFPLYSPTIKKIEIIRRGKTKRAKLFYLRRASGRKARLKAKEFIPEISMEETPTPDENGGVPAQAPENKENNLENKENSATD